MKLDEFNYNLPEELIGQKPAEPRDSSRLMLVDKESGNITHKKFYNIKEHLKRGDVLVINSTKVIPARIIGKKETGAVVELFLLKRLEIDTWECLARPGKKLREGAKVIFGGSKELEAEIIKVKDDGNRIVKFKFDGIFEDILDKFGEMPLPPYITEELKESERYQTVYARKGESVAAPTAGLHFTEELLKEIKELGIEIVEVFLEVGLGTFRPVKTDNILDHKMHKEYYEVPKESAEKINRAKKEGRRIIAVGTTSVRTLESAVDENGVVLSKKSSTEIFIYPGKTIKVVDGLITNFHLPKSTLLMLVSAFSSKEIMLEAYEVAVKERYSFFSFGDAMFIY